MRIFNNVQMLFEIINMRTWIVWYIFKIICSNNNLVFTYDSSINQDTIKRLEGEGRNLSCLTCEGSSCDKLKLPVLNCEGLHESCFTIFDQITGNVKAKLCRGDFTQELEIYCSQFPDYCLHCLSNRCNLAVNISEYVECVNCDSNWNEDCVKNSNFLETRKCYKNCMKIVWPNINRDVLRVIQGCLDDLEIDEQEDCKKFSHCRILEGNICYL